MSKVKRMDNDDNNLCTRVYENYFSLLNRNKLIPGILSIDRFTSNNKIKERVKCRF